MKALVLSISFILSALASAAAPVHSFLPSLSLLLDQENDCLLSADASDDFECDTLSLENSPWQFINQSSVNSAISAGALNLQLTQRRLWFDNNQGVFMYKPVTGNFKATTQLSVFKTSDSSELPDQAVQLAGLMLRDPSSDAGLENYVFVVAGFDVNDISVESKQTIDGVSEFVGPTWPSGEAELRLCRIESDIYLYKRLPGETIWQTADDPANGFSLPRTMTGLGSSVQLGLNIYTSINNFDVSAMFEFMHIEPVVSEADCLVD